MSAFPIKLRSWRREFCDSSLCPQCPAWDLPQSQVLSVLLLSTEGPTLGHSSPASPGPSQVHNPTVLSLSVCSIPPPPLPIKDSAVSDSLCHLTVELMTSGPADALSHIQLMSAKWMPKTPPAPSGKWHFGKWNV